VRYSHRRPKSRGFPPNARTLVRNYNPNQTTMISLEKLHATKREASSMLAEIVERIKETDWMKETVERVGLDPRELYEVVKAGSKWKIKATAAHLEATQQLHKINDRRNL
jgi:hypothetical protein